MRLFVYYTHDGRWFGEGWRSAKSQPSNKSCLAVLAGEFENKRHVLSKGTPFFVEIHRVSEGLCPEAQYDIIKRYNSE